MTQPRRGQLDRITPNPAVNKPPREVPSIALTTDLLSLYFNFIRDLVLAQVGLALGGINIFGVTPFAFLTDWGNKLRSDAAQAFAQGKASLAVAQSSNANSAVAIGEVQLIKGTASDAKDGLLLTWNELWAANTGQTVTTGQQKTVTEVKQSQTTVRQDGQNNTLNIQGTWDTAVQGSLYVTNPNATNQTLAQFKQALFGTSYTANQAVQASGTNTNNIQSTWNSIYEAAGGATGTDRTLSEAKTTLNGVTLNAQELIDALLNAIYGTSLTGQSRTNVAPALEERTTEVDEQFASGSNLALSPGFEETNLPRHAISGSAFPATPAASLTAPTGSYTSAVKRPGGGTRSWTWTSQTGQAGGLYLSPTRLSNVFTVRAGDWYYMEMWLYYTPPSGVAVSGSIQFGPWWRQSSSQASTDSRQVITLSTLTANSWNKLSGYFQVPSDRDTAYFALRTTGVPASFVFYTDDVMLREVTDAKEAAAAADLAQQAADDASDYVDDTQQAGSNLVLSPDFEKTTVPRLHVGTPGASTGYSTVVKKSGSYSYRYQQAAGAATGLYLAPTPTSAVITASVGDRFDVEAVVFSAHSGTPTGAIRVGVEWLNNGVALSPAQESYREWTLTGSSTDTDLVLPRNNWKTLKHTTVACPSGANGGRFFVYNTSATATSNLTYVDDVVVREVTAAATAQDAAGSAHDAADNAQNTADDAHAAIDVDRRAGSNIMLSPNFEDSSISRLLWGTTATATAAYSVTGYPNSAVSGTQGFRWTQGSNTTNGLVLTPSETSQYVIVQPGDRFDLEAMIYQANGSTTAGAIRIGVEWSQNSGGSPTLNSREYPLTSSLHQVWTKLNFTTPACPANYNTARFFVTVGPTSGGVNAVSGRTYTVDDVIVREVTVAQDTADAVNEGLGGTPTPPSGGATPSDIKTLTDDINKALGELGAAVSDLTNETDAAALAGEAFSVNFSTVGDSSNFPASFTATRYTTSGTHGGAQVSGGRLLYVPSAVNAMDNGRSLGMFTTVHGSQYQRVGVTLTSVLPYLVANNRGGNWIFARSTSDTNADALPDTGAFVRMYYPNLLAGLSNAARLVVGYVSGGVATAATTAVDFTYTVGSTYWLEAGNPSSTAETAVNQYRVLKDNYPLTNWITLPSLTGTRSGLALEVASDGVFRYDPARVAAWVALDNLPAATLGSGFRATRGSGTLNLPNVSGTPTVLPDSAMSQSRTTSDFSYSTTGNTLTVGVSGWYAVSVGLLNNVDFPVGQYLQAAVFVKETPTASNVVHTVGNQVSDFRQATANAIVYVAAGGTIQPGYASNGAMTLAAGDSRTFMNVAFLNNTVPKNPGG